LRIFINNLSSDVLRTLPEGKCGKKGKEDKKMDFYILHEFWFWYDFHYFFPQGVALRY
jgi:hypothetical protein